MLSAVFAHHSDLPQSFLLLDDQKSGLEPRFFYGRLRDLHPLFSSLNEKLGYGVFRTVNEFDGRGRRSENLRNLCGFYADFDRGIPSSAALQPTHRVESSRGKQQWYWVLETPVPATAENCLEYLGIQHALVKELKADENARDLTRVLRVPGFKNNKYPERPEVRKLADCSTCLNSEPRRFTMEQVRAAFGYIAPAPMAAVTPTAGGHTHAFRRCVLQYPPPAAGHGATNGWIYRAASYGLGTLGLALDDVIDALLDLNIEHVWHLRDEEIVRVARNAERYARRLSKTSAEIEVEL